MKEILELEKEIKELKPKSNKQTYKYIDEIQITKKAKKILEEIDKNYNQSFTLNAYARNKHNLDKNAIFYRGNKITYKELFSKVYKYAKSLKTMGYQKGDEIPVCMSNIPEFIYIYLAINLIGCKINSVPEWIDKDYLKMIIEKSKSKTMFISDDLYTELKEKITNTNLENLVVASLTDSLPKMYGKPIDFYKDIDKDFYEFKNKTEEITQSTNKTIIKITEFEEKGINYQGKVVEDIELNDPFAITYTSGTTNPGVPKAVLHSNRCYTTISRFHDKDISGLASMDGVSVLHHIPPYTHMELCSLGDSLFHGCLMNMEPIYKKEFFKYTIAMHKPNYSPGSVGFYLDLCNHLNYDPKFKNLDLTNFIAPTITGEGMSKGEEKYFNYTSRKHKFGTKELPFPVAPVSFSIGGGTGESSGIFTTLFKAHLEKLPQNYKAIEGVGLTTLPFCETEVLDENGKQLPLGQMGLLVSKSPCDMIGYYYNEQDFPGLTIKNPYITAQNGKEYLSLNTYSFKSDNHNRIKIKGRLDDTFHNIPLYKIEDEVAKDTKNIMSVSAVKALKEDNQEQIIIHIQFSPIKQNNETKIIEGIRGRLQNTFPQEMLKNIQIRVRSQEESFPIAPSGKRNRQALIEEGYNKEKCLPVISEQTKIKKLIK